MDMEIQYASLQLCMSMHEGKVLKSRANETGPSLRADKVSRTQKRILVPPKLFSKIISRKEEIFASSSSSSSSCSCSSVVVYISLFLMFAFYAFSCYNSA